MRWLILILTTFWVIIYSNARMFENLPSYHLVHIFPLPKATRGLELLVIFLLYLLALTRRMTRKILFINLCIIGYALLAILNLLVQGLLDFAAIQEIYIRLLPFFFFIIVVQHQHTSEKDLRFLTRFFGIVLFINILVAMFYQVPFYGYHEDNIHGLLEEAHLLGNILAVFSIVLFYDHIQTRSLRSLVLSILLLFISLFPSNEKVIVLNAAFIGMYYLYSFIRSSRGLFIRTVKIISILLLAMLSVFWVAENGGAVLWKRAQVVVNYVGVENIGPVLAWPMAVGEISSGFSSFIFGLGAGEYGWIAASNKVIEGKGSVHSNLFKQEFVIGSVNNAGFMFRTNTWSSLLAEFGLLGFILFVIPLMMIVKAVYNYRACSRLEKNMRMAFFSVLALVIFQGLFTPYSNWSTPVLMLPMMYIAAYFIQPSLSLIKNEKA